jgi:hypothetical protein
MRSSFTAVGIQATTGGPSSRIAIYNSGDISAGVARPTRLPTAHRALLCARQRHRHHQQGRHKCRHLRDNRVQSLDCIGSSSTALARDVRCELHPKRQSADVRRPRQSRDAHAHYLCRRTIGVQGGSRRAVALSAYRRMRSRSGSGASSPLSWSAAPSSGVGCEALVPDCFCLGGAASPWASLLRGPI